MHQSIGLLPNWSVLRWDFKFYLYFFLLSRLLRSLGRSRMRRSFVNFVMYAWQKAQPAARSTNASSSIYLHASTASAIMSQLRFWSLRDSNFFIQTGEGTLLQALLWYGWQNVYMSLFARIRLEVKRERVQIMKEEEAAK